MDKKKRNRFELILRVIETVCAVITLILLLMK